MTRKRRSQRIVNSVATRRSAQSPTAAPLVSIPSSAAMESTPAAVPITGGLLHNNNGTAAVATTSSGVPATLQDLTTNAQHRNISNAMRLLSPKDKQQAAPAAATATPTMPNYQQFLSPPPNLYPMQRMSPTNNGGSFVTHRPADAQILSPPQQHHQQQQRQHQAAAFQNHHHAHSHQQQCSQQRMNQQESASSIPSLSQQQHHQQHIPNLFGTSNAPPITVLVPYPVLMPVPIPIPIPMPILAFLRAAQLKLDADNNNSSRQSQPPTAACEQKRASEQQANAGAQLHNGNNANNTTDDQPLDCTKTRELSAEDDPEQLIEVVCDEEDDDGAAAADDESVINSADEDSADRDGHHGTAVRSTSEVTRRHQTEDTNEPLPKFKITRLNARRGFITTSSSEPLGTTSSEAITTTNNNPPITAINRNGDAARVATELNAETSRPLRKRKRIIDCDYNRIKDDDRRKNTTSGGSQK